MHVDFQFLMVVVDGSVEEAFKVSLRDRVQQRSVERISLTFQLHMVVVDGAVMKAFKVSPRDRVQQRSVEQISLASQSLRVVVFKVSSQDRFLLLHPRTRLVLWMRLLQGFSHFSPNSKKCAVGSALGVGTGCGL